MKTFREITGFDMPPTGANTFYVGEGGYGSIQKAVDKALKNPQIKNELKLTGKAVCINGSNIVDGETGSAVEKFGTEIAVSGFGYELIAFSNDDTRDWYPIRDIISESKLLLSCPFFGVSGTYDIYVAEKNMQHIEILNDSSEYVNVFPKTGVSGKDEMACLSFNFNDTAFNGNITTGQLDTGNNEPSMRYGVIKLKNLRKRAKVDNSKSLIQSFSGLQPGNETAVSYILENVDARLFGSDVVFFGDSCDVEIRNSHMASMQDGNYTNSKGKYYSSDSVFHCGYGDWDASGSGAAIKTPLNGFGSSGLSVNDTFILTPKKTLFNNTVEMSFIKQISAKAESNEGMVFSGATFKSNLDLAHNLADNVTFCSFDNDTENTDDGIDLTFIDCNYVETGSQPINPIPGWKTFTSGNPNSTTAIKKKLHIIRSTLPDWPNDWEDIEVVEFEQTNRVKKLTYTGGFIPAGEIDLLRATTFIIENVNTSLIIPAPTGVYPDGAIVNYVISESNTPNVVFFGFGYYLSGQSQPGAGVAGSVLNIGFKFKKGSVEDGILNRWVINSGSTTWNS